MSNEMNYTMDAEDIQSALSDDAFENETENYLIFRSDGIQYGVNADQVDEILTEIAVTRVPLVPPHVRGVVNLRGQIVPILDFRLLLGRMPNEDCCAIILEIEDTQIGIMVDTVDQMVDIAKSTILPVPPQQREQRMICGMCTVPNGSGTMMVLDCPQLLRS